VRRENRRAPPEIGAAPALREQRSGDFATVVARNAATLIEKGADAQGDPENRLVGFLIRQHFLRKSTAQVIAAEIVLAGTRS
jgi:hypothetical protein